MQLKLYNTMSKEKETFSPLNKSEARIYACGPTVYHYQHIGNLRNYLFNDILKRVLLFNKYKVKQVINITDVGHLTSDEDSGEDKMIKTLKREKLDISEESLLTLAKKYEAVWQNDMVKINILPAEVYCKATEHVKDMVEMIEKIEKNGFSYESDSCVYFDISKFKDYNKLARLKLENLEAGARVAVDKEKKNPGDFVLWFKTVGKHEKHIMQWDSKYGKGFPGWHIECSAMSVKYLGEQFDIHTGGIEHVPVHHTNEIAQTEASTGKKPWVKYWMHGEHLTLAKEKMSKSLGNVFLLDDLIKKGFDPLAFRYLCLGSHYRKQMIFTLESLEGAQNSLNKLRNKVLELMQKDEGERAVEDYIERFQDAINDDLNMPKALAAVWDMVKDEEVNSKERYDSLMEFDRVLGLGLEDIKSLEIPEDVQRLLEEREHARLNKHWNDADALRDEIKKKGYIIDDGVKGPVLKRV